MPKAGKKHIYLVDDHPVVRESLTFLLNQEPDLSVCGEAEDAGRALKDIPVKNPDLVIIDISLNASSGFELIKSLKSILPHLGIVIFSMHDEKLYAERCIRAGAGGYVMKRESTRRILGTVRDVLAGKMSVSDQIASLFAQKFIEGRHLERNLPLAELSDRELEVFNLFGQGLSSRKVAQTLDINIKTVQAHCARIKQKLHLSTATELLHEATKWHDESSAFGS
jgi:DNA-binding NarL/FixJ family response regulator